MLRRILFLAALAVGAIALPILSPSVSVMVRVLALLCVLLFAACLRLTSEVENKSTISLSLRNSFTRHLRTGYSPESVPDLDTLEPVQMRKQKYVELMVEIEIACEEKTLVREAVFVLLRKRWGRWPIEVPLSQTQISFEQHGLRVPLDKGLVLGDLSVSRFSLRVLGFLPTVDYEITKSHFLRLEVVPMNRERSTLDLCFDWDSLLRKESGMVFSMSDQPRLYADILRRKEKEATPQ